MTENEAIEIINKNLHQGNLTLALDIARKSITELQQYRAIGTVEECREAREKQKEKKSIEYKNKTDALVDKLRKYAAEYNLPPFGREMSELLLDAAEYNLPPFGREIEGTSELLLEAAETIEILTIEFEEHMRYRAIGTVEECRNARERQIGKKPVKDEYNHDCCPNCGWVVYQDEWGGRYLPHCENCGQAIDFSEV